MPLMDRTSARRPEGSPEGLIFRSQAAVAALTPFFPRPILCSSSTAPATRGRGYFSPGRGMYLHIHPLEISSTDTCEC